MKIAVCVDNGERHARVDDRFGRCRFFVVAQQGEEPQLVQNPAAEAGGGAGRQAARFLSQQDVEVVLAGRFGPKAAEALRLAGIRMVEAAGRSVDEVLGEYGAGRLRE